MNSLLKRRIIIATFIAPVTKPAFNDKRGSDKEKEKVQHAAEIQSLKNETERQITELNSSGADKLQSTIKQYQSQLQDTIERYESQLENTSSQYEEKLKASRDELTKKNANLLSELQQTQKNHQAVINRIRGLSS